MSNPPPDLLGDMSTGEFDPEAIATMETRREARIYRQMFRGEVPPYRTKSDEPISLDAHRKTEA